MALPQGITKEFLDMTYPDQYYRNVIEPAKLGKGPVPGKIEMLSKAQPFKAMRIGIDPYLPKSMQTGYDAFRAAPTKAAATALGWGAKGLGYLASLPAQAALMTLHSTPANADEVEWEKQLMKNQQFKQQQFMNKKKQDMQRRIREAEKKRIEQAQTTSGGETPTGGGWKPTYNPASSHAEAQATGGDYHSGHESTVGGQTTDWGPNSAMIARGGLAQYAPRGSYFNGGLASLYRHGGF
jgi:hypothetical protein